MKGRGDERLLGDLACPSCTVVLDASSEVEALVQGRAHARPEPGDYSVCAYCEALLVFARHPFGLTLRIATEAELAAEAPAVQRQVRDAQHTARVVNEQLGRSPLVAGDRRSGAKWN